MHRNVRGRRETSFNEHSLCPFDAALSSHNSLDVLECAFAVARSRGEVVSVRRASPVTFVDIKPWLARQLLLG